MPYIGCVFIGELHIDHEQTDRRHKQEWKELKNLKKRIEKSNMVFAERIAKQ